jgi:imidazole glycerol-phosphate synthase subunit HisH
MSNANKQLVIIDYGLGNLFSLRRALTHIGYEPTISSEPDVIQNASHLFLPGVGAFGDGMKNLDKAHLIDPIKEAVQQGTPLMGICLGMQLLMSESEEFGLHKGLNLISGRVVRFQDAVPPKRYKVPNIGWCAIEVPESQKNRNNGLLRGVNDGSYFYFVHSYKVTPNHTELTVAVTDYAEGKFCSVIVKDLIYGCQFHPEKSGDAGLRVLKNFVTIKESNLTGVSS